MLSSYPVSNLIRTVESLLELSKELGAEVAQLQSVRDDVIAQQQEAHRQGQMVKKMTDYLSNELGRMECDMDSGTAAPLSKNLDKLSQTETKLRILRGRLDEFVEGDDEECLKRSNTDLSADLKRYESFLTEFAGLLNERIPQMEKIAAKIRAETRESQQQKILLREMVDLFNSELEDLDCAFAEIRSTTTVS